MSDYCEFCGYGWGHHPDCIEGLAVASDAAIKRFYEQGVPMGGLSARARMERSEASERQVGGNHYTKMVITPREYGIANELDWDQINVVKYVSRHHDKNGLEDLEKAKHYIDLIIERYYL